MVPLTALCILPLTLEADRDTGMAVGPERVFQAIVKFVLPLATEKLFDRLSADDKFSSVSPSGVFGLTLGDDVRIACVPRVLYRFDHCLCRCLRERGPRGMWHIRFLLIT